VLVRGKVSEYSDAANRCPQGCQCTQLAHKIKLGGKFPGHAAPNDVTHQTGALIFAIRSIMGQTARVPMLSA
jgi:hypothetical protein